MLVKEVFSLYFLKSSDMVSSITPREAEVDISSALPALRDIRSCRKVAQLSCHHDHLKEEGCLLNQLNRSKEMCRQHIDQGLRCVKNDGWSENG
jgi:hypothetical protein